MMIANTIFFSLNVSIIWTIIVAAAVILVLLNCVCNPKQKGFQKNILTKNDVPPSAAAPTAITTHNTSSAGMYNLQEMNSIVTTTNGGVCSTALTEAVTGIDHNGKHNRVTSFHRALPDIPQASGSSNNNQASNNKLTGGDPAIIMSNDTSADDIDSLYAIANNNAELNNIHHHNHPYAKIGDNHVVDSSTENDTDDYSEPQRMPQRQPPNIRPNIGFELEMHHPHLPHLMKENKNEISYNTISVREPMAKVLAERENFEHHYNEVEDEERVSSFYEEITTGSATYSKINEIDLHSTDMQQPSTSASTFQLPQPSTSSNLPLYSFVDKKAKKKPKQTISTNPTINITSNVFEFNNLYTKVNKSPKKSETKSSAGLQRYSPPPPLPPPLNKDAQSTNKYHRNTIMFGTPTGDLNHQHHPHHQLPKVPQSYSTDTNNIYQKISPEEEEEEEKEPGYETVYKEVDPYNTINEDQNDYGYEAIKTDSESDPAYEIVQPPPLQTFTATSTVVPVSSHNGYETIKIQDESNVLSRPLPPPINGNDVEDNDDDDSEEENSPNYEVITRRNRQNIVSVNNEQFVPITTTITTAPRPQPALERVVQHHHHHHHHLHHHSGVTVCLNDHDPSTLNEDTIVIIEHL